MICNVSKLKGTFGIRICGNPPAIFPTVLVSNFRKYATAKVTKIATNEAGTAFVSFGRNQIIAIVSKTKLK